MKVRVLHAIPNFGPGGAERLLVNLLEQFDRERFEVAAVSLYPETGTILEREIREKKINVYYLNKHKGPDPRMVPQLWHIFRDFRPDVVHTHRYVLRYTLLPAYLCRIPVQVHTVHSIAQKEVDRVGKIIHWFAFRFAGVVPVSICREVAMTVRRIYGQNMETPVIYNGIPTVRFSVYSNCQSENDDIVFLHIGRFSQPKNHKLLIEAFKLAVKECPKMRLWLVGDGELRPAIQNLVAEKGLSRYVSFLGIRADVAELLGQGDVFVLPSNWEGVPLTILEAMAAGKPVVATSVGGVPELVESGVTGILVPPGDVASLANAFLKLANDPKLRQSMGKEGQKKARECFDIAFIAREYESLYLKLLRERKRA
ncbi:glycosyltransferase [Acetomicrobium sp.]|uniref:glycosyltransferase n=1 Tax=Acetomicrobium sp. TaxID=1872099 RepID=UPI002B259AF2|nr:glycosyltransferase [Acetomicrobium sp.]